MGLFSILLLFHLFWCKIKYNYSVGLRIYCADRKKVYRGQAKIPSPTAILHGFWLVTVRVASYTNSAVRLKRRYYKRRGNYEALSTFIQPHKDRPADIKKPNLRVPHDNHRTWGGKGVFCTG